MTWPLSRNRFMNKRYYTLTIEVNDDHVPPWMNKILAAAVEVAVKELQVKCAMLSPAALTVGVSLGEYDSFGRWVENKLDFGTEQTKEESDAGG